MKRLYVERNAPEKVWKEIKDEGLTEYAYRVLQTAKWGDCIKLPRGLWLIRKYKHKKHTIRCLESCYLYQDNYTIIIKASQKLLGLLWGQMYLAIVF